MRRTCSEESIGRSTSSQDAMPRGEKDQQDRKRPADCRVRSAMPPGVRSSWTAYGLRITRVAAVPVFLPCHSANRNAAFTSESGKLWETTLESG